MSTSAKVRHYALRLPAEDAVAVQAVCAETKASFNRIVSLCVRKALPAVRAALSAQTGRVTNVDPLPAAAARRLYSQPDDDAEAIQLFMAAQCKDAEA
jgi:hypothetical protein